VKWLGCIDTRCFGFYFRAQYEILLIGAVKMINIGIFTTRGGRSYDCCFIPENRSVQAVGPLPPAGDVGARGIAFETNAESEKEARTKIEEAVEKGLLK